MFLKKFLLFGLIATTLPAVAEEAADRKTATSLKYVEHELDTRQDKFGADTNKAMEYTNSAGDVQKRAVTSELGSSTSDTSLPMVGGVNTKLNQKQDDIDPVNDHTAVTYTGTAGGIGRKGIYQTTGTYTEQSDNLIDAKTFNAALKKGLDTEFKCRDYKPDTDLCWVYSIHNATENHGKNLFDISTATRYNTRYVSGGTWTPLTETSVAQTYGLNVAPNTTYTISKVGGNRLCITCFTQISVPNYETQLVPDYIIRGVVEDFGTGSYTFTTPSNCNWLLFTVKNNSSSASDATNIQVELGSTATPYVPYVNVYIPQNQ